MTIFLTSDPMDRPFGHDRSIPAPLKHQNRFVEQLKARWKENSPALYISGMPNDFEINALAAPMYQKALQLSGLTVSTMDLCDRQHPTCDLTSYDFVILGGGHVPTQNTFFQEIGLQDTLRGYQGIVMGISAGTMNSASTVYAQPELEGEATDPSYQRFIPGLGLTDIMVLPHFQMLRDLTLDGQRILEDITFPDSAGRKIYALVDGSYILVENGVSRLYGEGFLIENGVLTQICREDESIAL